ncbi:mechanosensitive ion channel family protein [Larsenimonas suaedae]|uniref:Small-conductance mechanosensitive channel n=1 Tax=Larsenimonas suaedae TaxID=1851019 RepID=A0ABU1GSK6_9GAMM|nr:mechanosensitive ion channel family protein [Larsenimonas suaedae]MCM2972195.1 mechanosensitive ion channel family protein [Larsenimonas suaedae]MDR5895009.1 mechanosensitive ion channel family protein [Larsenimonas suaedae]
MAASFTRSPATRSTSKPRARRLYLALALMLGTLITAPSYAADELSSAAGALAGSSAASETGSGIETAPTPEQDRAIQARIEGIFSELEGLEAVTVTVTQGVVTLEGETANDRKAQQALGLANRLTDVVAVNDTITRTLDVQDNVATAAHGLAAQARNLVKALPLLGVGIVVFGVVAWFGAWLSRRKRLWQRLTPNPFVAELLSQTVKVVFIVFALILALSLMGAETIIGTLLGGAGVIGIAVGFAVKDTIENYIASLMLSIRQPFRARDQVVINGQEGIVVRLTSRATILMTLDGNQLRIPNAEVFKGTILNYTQNPERRFTFELGVDADDDPLAAIKVGLDAVNQLAFVLTEPRAAALITHVGDSNIVLEFQVWVNQSNTDFAKARSIAIRETKHALERTGFSLPEPIYRLRFNASLEQALERLQGALPAHSKSDTEHAHDAPSAQAEGSPAHPAKARAESILKDPTADALFDARPDEKLKEKVEEEIARGSDETDLLSQKRQSNQ